MFTLKQNITGPELRKKELLKFFFSMNTHQVATPEMMLEEARSYILFFREAGGKCSSYVGLHLLATGRRLFYAHAANPFPAEESASVEEEALDFVEGLGALTDATDLAKLASEEKMRWSASQDIFTLNPLPVVSPEARPVDAAVPEKPAVLQEPPAPAAAQAARAPVWPHAKPVARAVRSKTAPLAAAGRDRQDLTQKTTKSGGVKDQKPSIKKDVPAGAGVVSRDREALARLLASF